MLRRETVHHGEGGEANHRIVGLAVRKQREDKKWGQAKQPQDPPLMAHILSEALQVDRPQLELLPGIFIWVNQNPTSQGTWEAWCSCHLNSE